MKLQAKHNNQIFEIVEDKPEVGFYLNIYNNKNECIADYLQDSETITKEFALEEFGVPIENWIAVT